MNSRVYALVAAGLWVTAGAASAHHNMSALFDFNNRVSLSGTLTKYDWRNPHIYLTIEVKGPKDEMETWQVEGPPPSFFRIRDISKMDFENASGKMVKFEASRARDGSHTGLLRVMTLPDGKLVSACPQNC
jgi:Family of unknown function (DUF6152)